MWPLTEFFFLFLFIIGFISIECCVSNVYARNRRTYARRDKVEALETDKIKFCHFNESECIRIDKRNWNVDKARPLIARFHCLFCFFFPLTSFVRPFVDFSYNMWERKSGLIRFLHKSVSFWLVISWKQFTPFTVLSSSHDSLYVLSRLFLIFNSDKSRKKSQQGKQMQWNHWSRFEWFQSCVWKNTTLLCRFIFTSRNWTLTVLIGFLTAQIPGWHMVERKLNTSME